MAVRHPIYGIDWWHPPHYLPSSSVTVRIGRREKGSRLESGTANSQRYAGFPASPKTCRPGNLTVFEIGWVAWSALFGKAPDLSVFGLCCEDGRLFCCISSPN